MLGYEALFALKTQIKKDYTGERSYRFTFFISRRPAIQFCYRTISSAPVVLRGVFCALYAATLSAWRADFGQGKPIAAVKYANEKKQIDLLWPTLEAKGFERWVVKPAPVRSLLFFGRLAILNPAQARRVVRVSSRLCQRYPLYVAMRATETLLSYLFSRKVFGEKRPPVVVSSSDGNPYGRALMAAAHAEEIPLVFVSHGPVAETPVRVKVALAVLHGISAIEDFTKRGSKIADFLLFGYKRNGGMRKLDQVRRVLICLGGAPEIENLRVAAGEILERFPGAEICVRPHPHTNMEKKFFESARLNAWKISSASSVSSELLGCDIVVAANSTVHLECLAAGVASLYAPSLDSHGIRPLSFVRTGLLASWIEAKTTDDINAHYSRPGYQELLNRYMSQESSSEEFLIEFSRRIDGLIHAGLKT